MTSLPEVAEQLSALKRPVAVLVGSGVSRSAGVPTGHDILRSIARGAGVDCGEDPVRWYIERFGRFPDYFALVGAEAGVDALPTMLFTGGEPTPAHRSLAALCAAGVAGPILTTNVDPYLESALGEAGVAHTVVSDLAGISQADYLTGLVLIKLHGDFRDISIRNASPALHVYPAAVDSLVRRVLERFDLLVCGWSASWDLPLARAVREAGADGRRVFWLQCGPPSALARSIWRERRALVVEVDSSDAGLVRLAEGWLAGPASPPTPHPPPTP